MEGVGIYGGAWRPAKLLSSEEQRERVYPLSELIVP